MMSFRRDLAPLAFVAVAGVLAALLIVEERPAAVVAAFVFHAR